MNDRPQQRVRPAASDAGTKQGHALALKNPEPWPERVDGADLLTKLRGTFVRHLVLPKRAAVALALWVLHTYLIDTIDLSPVLAINSPQKRCGKTTLLTLLLSLCQRTLLASNITAPALFRTIEIAQPTLLIDEADTFISHSNELRGVLNAGHTRASARVIRTVGQDFEPREFHTFCPKAIAGIGRLPGTVEDRSIIIRMKRKKPGESTERLRGDRADHDLEPLRRQCVRWANDNRDAVRKANPAVPDSLDDRAADNWRPLLAIANAAGGDWPERARRAAVALSSERQREDDDVHVQLLADIRAIFQDLKAESMSTKALLKRLNAMGERPWKEWDDKGLTEHKLARLLRPFGVTPAQLWDRGKNQRGYRAPDFADAWSRYLPTQSLDPLEPAPAADLRSACHPLGTRMASGCRTPRKALRRNGSSTSSSSGRGAVRPNARKRKLRAAGGTP